MKNKQCGSALLVAILLVVITALLASSIAFTTRLFISQTHSIDNRIRMQTALQGVQDWAIAVLTAQAKSPQLYSPHIIHFTKKKFYGVHLQGELIDQQGLFNLNLLRYSSQIDAFERLLQLSHLQITPVQQQILTQHIYNWITNPAVVALWYANQKIPYRPAGQPFVESSELCWVQGITNKIYRQLQPSITAFPTVRFDDIINVNSVTLPVLSSYFPNTNLAQIQHLFLCIQSNKPIRDLALLKTACFDPQLLRMPNNFNTVSYFYLLRASAKIAQQTMVLTSLLMIQPNAKVNVVWQKL